jgi:hypothetical protein
MWGDCGKHVRRNGNALSRTDFNNKKVCYTYEPVRNLETARAEGILSNETCSTVLATLPPRADVRKISTQWHGTWRLPTKIAEPNRLTTNAYNGDGGGLLRSYWGRRAVQEDGTGNH